MEQGIKILQEFKELIPPLIQGEYEQLTENILNEGCREPLIVWAGKNILVDGHNRYEICTKHNLEFQTVHKVFENEAEVKLWIIQNQLGRRNLNTAQVCDLVYAKKEIIAKQAKENQGTRTDIFQKSEKSLDEVKQPINTTKQLAEDAGVSIDTMSKYIKIKENSTPETISSILEGKDSINKAYKEIKRGEKPQLKPKTPVIKTSPQLFPVEEIEDITGLNQTIKELEDEIIIKDARIVELEAENEQLKQLLSEQSGNNTVDNEPEEAESTENMLINNMQEDEIQVNKDVSHNKCDEQLDYENKRVLVKDEWLELPSEFDMQGKSLELLIIMATNYSNNQHKETL